MVLIIGYSALALIACFFGSITGMGGGVIIKPIMDMLGNYDSMTISILSSAAVFAMSAMSALRSIGSKPQIKWLQLLMLSAGSVVGGLVGQELFKMVVDGFNDDITKIVQNSILLGILVLICVYMILSARGKIKNLNLKNPVIFAGVGVVLGLLGAFLGIGGGPINVAVIMYLFNVNIKTATFSSIVTMLCSQASKLIVTLATKQYVGLDLGLLPYVVIFAVLGALLGSFVSKKVSPKIIGIFFNGMQVVVMSICVSNIVICAT